MIAQFILPTPYENLSILPSRHDLEALQTKLEAKHKIYKLRDDYRRAKGTAYSLRDFHDQFVRQGGIPIKLLRRILLPGDTAAVY